MKKAETKVLSIWWFFVLAVIGVAIISSTLIFVSGNNDSRKLESEILMNKILACYQEYPAEIFQRDFSVSLCGLSEIIEKSGKFYVFLQEGDKIKEIGNSAFYKDCLLTAKISAKNYPQCFQKEIKLHTDLGITSLKIITGSNNVK